MGGGARATICAVRPGCTVGRNVAEVIICIFTRIVLVHRRGRGRHHVATTSRRGRRRGHVAATGSTVSAVGIICTPFGAMIAKVIVRIFA